jgi:hypothetical protein
VLIVTVVSFSAGCGFFSLDDSTPEAAQSNGGAGKSSGGSTSNTGGTLATGGSGGTGGGAGGDAASAGSGGVSGTGTGTGGSDAAGSSMGGMNAAGGAGGTTAGAPAAGSAGDAAGGRIGSAGMAGSGMSGMAGNGAAGCAAFDAKAKSHAGHCYLLVTNKANWADAKSGCSDKGGGAHLVTISSAAPLAQSDFDAENSFVFDTLGGKQETWLGATDGKMDHDAGDGSPFTWVTGEDMTLTNWNSGEPNNYNKNCMDGSNCYEHCVFMMTDPAGKWNDELCEATKQYVCEWDMGGDAG